MIEAKSPGALVPAGRCDVYLLDGDHNFETLTGELQALTEVCEDRPFLVLLHDVGWPNARRDMYYRADNGSTRTLHAACLSAGAVPGTPGVVAWGFRGEGDFSIALEEGGRTNGVLSAVEAFLESTSGFRFLRIPCIFGLGVLFPADAPWAGAIESELAPYNENPLLARMEENRLALFLKVLQLQDGLVAAKRELELLRGAQREDVEDVSADVLRLLEQLALLSEADDEPNEDRLAGDDLPSTLETARRVLSYDVYLARVKARRVVSRLRQAVSGS